MTKPTVTEIPTEIPDRFNLTGAELSAITQASAYQAIRETKGTDHTGTTESNIVAVEEGIQNLSGFRPEAHQIWRVLRDKAIERPVSDFLWKVAHGIHRVGKYWKNIPGYEERGQCQHCETTESMEHILFECQEPGQSQIWGTAEEVWSRTGNTWPGHDMATLLGGGLLRFEPVEIQEADEGSKKKKKKKDGRQRLLTILLTESAYLIWKLRNERRIRGKEHTTSEITNRWYANIDRRITLDRAMANPAKFAKKALDPDLVKRTWSGTLQNEKDLPNNWIWKGEVLVGRWDPPM